MHDNTSYVIVQHNVSYLLMGGVGTSATSRPQECGCSLIPDARIRRLASRAVATPFVGALAAALVLAEIIRPLHGGGVHSTLIFR